MSKSNSMLYYPISLILSVVFSVPSTVTGNQAVSDQFEYDVWLWGTDQTSQQATLALKYWIRDAPCDSALLVLEADDGITFHCDTAWTVKAAAYSPGGVRLNLSVSTADTVAVRLRYECAGNPKSSTHILGYFVDVGDSLEYYRVLPDSHPSSYLTHPFGAHPPMSVPMIDSVALKIARGASRNFQDMVWEDPTVLHPWQLEQPQMPEIDLPRAVPRGNEGLPLTMPDSTRVTIWGIEPPNDSCLMITMQLLALEDTASLARCTLQVSKSIVVALSDAGIRDYTLKYVDQDGVLIIVVWSAGRGYEIIR